MSNTALLGAYGDLANSGLNFRNLLINGNFDIWQRGGSLGPFTADAYVADRWRITKNDTVNFSVDLGVFGIGQTDVPNNPRYFHRLRLNAIGTAVEFVATSQRIEDVTRTSGQTLTLSFWARADQALTINPAAGTNQGAITINQNFGTGGSPSTAVNTIVQQSQAITTTWTKYTYTFTVPSVSGKSLGTDANSSYLQISIFPLVAGNAGRYIDIAQVQLEVGNTATPFERRPYALELALCQRYCLVTTTNAPMYLVGQVDVSNTRSYFSIQKSMRAAPTLSPTGVSYLFDSTGEVGLTNENYTIMAADTTGFRFYVNRSKGSVNWVPIGITFVGIISAEL
jgi:hypothetical protein